MSQTQFGEIGGVTKKTQMLYESGERLPDAAYLRAVTQIGVDAQYVLTGVRSKNLDELMVSDEFVAETAQELRGKSLSGLPLVPQIPVVRKAHKFVSRMIVLMATGQLREEDIDVLDGLAARLAKPPEESVAAAAALKTEPRRGVRFGVGAQPGKVAFQAGQDKQPVVFGKPKLTAAPKKKRKTES